MEIKDQKRNIMFPIRVGCIDVGSNAIRFCVAEFSNAYNYKIIDSTRASVRLGHEVFLCGKLEQKAMDSALKALKDFKNRFDELKVKYHRAVATSAVRESVNGDFFVEQVKKETGLNLHIITGTEELRLVYIAVKNKIPLEDKKWVLIDVGGGSVEVALVDNSGIIWSESHTMGSVRLLEELKDSVEEPGSFRRLLEEYISILKIPSFTQYKSPNGIIATGGNIEELAKLALAKPDKNNVSFLPLSELQSLTKSLSRLSFNQRVKELGLKEDRADVILPAAMVYEKVAQLVGENKIIIPYIGTKEGILIDIVENLLTSSNHKKRQENQSINAIVNLGRKYLFEESHCLHVAKLSLSLFDQLKSIHQLDEDERRLLYAAASLHDIGMFISYKKHHKHSLYIISQSELPYYTSKEMLIVANIARYHRKNEPQSSHEFYNRLTEQEKIVVSKLSAILRMADALDREHLQKVRDIKVKIDKPNILLQIDGIGEFHLEKWALKNKSQMFSKLFGLKVKLVNEKGES